MGANEQDGPEPFTLAEAEEWLHKLEDDTVTTSEMNFALLTILYNLVTYLDRRGVLDAQAFMLDLRERAQAGPELRARPVVRVVIDDLLAQLARPSTAESGEPSPH